MFSKHFANVTLLKEVFFFERIWSLEQVSNHFQTTVNSPPQIQAQRGHLRSWDTSTFWNSKHSKFFECYTIKNLRVTSFKLVVKWWMLSVRRSLSFFELSSSCPTNFLRFVELNSKIKQFWSSFSYQSESSVITHHFFSSSQFRSTYISRSFALKKF